MYLSVISRGKVEQVTTCRSCDGDNIHPKETYGCPIYQEYVVKIKKNNGVVTMENVNYELLMLVGIVCFVIGATYGRIANTIAWRNEIENIKWKSIPKNMTEAVSAEKLSGIKDTPVYVVTLNALAEIFTINNPQEDSTLIMSNDNTLPMSYNQEDQQ